MKPINQILSTLSIQIKFGIFHARLNYFKMASHNIDQTSLINYICSSFEAFGIIHVKKQIIKNARDDKSEAFSSMLRLLFDLVILHLINYDYTISQLGINHQAIDENDMQLIIMAHLSEINCPFLIKRYHQGNQLQLCHLEKNSSRSILILVGWMMSISDFFGNLRKLFHKIYSFLYVTKKYQTTKQNMKAKLSEQHGKQQFESIQIAYKQFRMISHRIQCLNNKKQNIQRKIQKQLKKFNKINKTNHIINLTQIMKNSNAQNSPQFFHQEQKLINNLKIQKQGLKNQQYFWKWLQVRVILPYNKSISIQYPNFYQEPQKYSSTPFRIEASSEYLSKYLKSFENNRQHLQALNQRVQPLISILQFEDKGKKTKQMRYQVEKQIIQEVNQIIGDQQYQNKVVEIPSFVGIELKKNLKKNGYSFGKKQPNIQQFEQSDMNLVDTKKQQLKSELQQFINSLDAIKFL